MFLSLSLLVACSAESAPDNAAGAVKKAPTASPTPTKEVLPEPTVEAFPELSKVDKAEFSIFKKDPYKAPLCGNAVSNVCEDARRQKFCMCRGAGTWGTYMCGCYAEDWPGLPPKQDEDPRGG